MKTRRFEATGTGRFPFDMLRYDSCWPARQADVTAMTSDRDERTVHLESASAPTVDRWLSFGWRVTT